MCDEIAVLEKGKLIAHGNVAAIQAQLQGEKVLDIFVTNGIDVAISLLEQSVLVKNIQSEDNKLTFSFSGTLLEQSALLKELLNAGVGVYSVNEETYDLEDIFIAITKGVVSNETI